MAAEVLAPHAPELPERAFVFTDVGHEHLERDQILGAAAAEGKTIVVDNVVNDTRYVPGSSMVKSEIVIPIFARGKLVAELDIQSYFTDTFKDPVDREFVESCAKVVAKYAEGHREKA